MADDESLVSVVAHGLLNEMAVIQGLLMQARDLLEPTTPRNDRAEYLLQLTELRTIGMVDSLRRYAWGFAPGDQQHSARVLRLVSPSTDGPGPE